MEQSWTSTGLGKFVIVLGVLIILLAGAVLLFPSATPEEASVTENNQGEVSDEPKLHTSMGQLQIMWWGNDMVQVFQPLPLPESVITSRTIQVSGKARGNWFFEASAPVHIVDADGKTVLSFPMTAQGEWMTTELVDFSGEGKLTASLKGDGWIVFEKDNPSGLPEYAQEYRMPVKFDVK